MQGEPPGRGLSRRSAVRMLGAVAGVSLLAACQPSPQSPPPSSGAGTNAPTNQAGPAGTTTTASNATPQARSGGTLRQGQVGDLPNVDGHWINGTNTISPIWDRLIEYDSALKVVPVLAERVEPNPAFTEVTFALRQGVRFHTGREFTSEDARWNFSRIKTDPKVSGGGYNNLIAPLTAMETPDKYTLVLKSDTPWPGVFDVVSRLNMLDPENMTESNGGFKAVGTQPVGTGPFMFVEWVQGDHIRLKKNPSYWLTGKPYLDEIEIKIFADPQSMVSTLEASGLDLAVATPLRDTTRLQKDGNYQVQLNQFSGARWVVGVQCTQQPGTNRQLRQALNYSLDRRRMVDSVLLGIGDKACLPFAPTSPAYDKAKDTLYAFDLDKAKSLVEASGVSNPELDMNYNTAQSEMASMAQIWQRDLATIGVKLNLKPLEQVVYYNQLFNATYSGLMGGISLFGQLHPGFMRSNPWFSPLNNWTGYKSDQLTQLADAMRTQVDPVKAKQSYADWSDFVLQESFTLSIATNVPVTIAQKSVRGLRYNVSEFLMTNDASLA